MNFKNVLSRKQGKRGASENTYRDSMFKNPPPRDNSTSNKAPASTSNEYFKTY